MAPTPLDRMLSSRNAFFAFTGMVLAVGTWAAMSDTPIFPPIDDPSGNPEDWSEPELRKWLSLRHLEPAENATRQELIERVKLNTRERRE